MSKYKEKGNECFKQKKYKDAIEFYNKAIKEDPNNHIYHSNKATCYYNLNEFTTALESVQKTIDINPSFMKTYICGSFCFEKLNDTRKAVRIIFDGLKQNPKEPTLKTRLSHLRDKYCSDYLFNIELMDSLLLECGFGIINGFILQSCFLKKTDMYERYLNYNQQQRQEFFDKIPFNNENPIQVSLQRHFHHLIVHKPQLLCMIIQGFLFILQKKKESENCVLFDIITQNLKECKVIVEFVISEVVNLSLEFGNFFEVSKNFFSDYFTIFNSLLEEFPMLEKKKKKRKRENDSMGKRKKNKIEKICQKCEKKENLLKCGNCKEAYYCSRDCQKLDWVSHKSFCKSKE
eukprot:gene5236-8847_t